MKVVHLYAPKLLFKIDYIDVLNLRQGTRHRIRMCSYSKYFVIAATDGMALHRKRSCNDLIIMIVRPRMCHGNTWSIVVRNEFGTRARIRVAY
jgi:hypothetical protein